MTRAVQNKTQDPSFASYSPPPEEGWLRQVRKGPVPMRSRRGGQRYFYHPRPRLLTCDGAADLLWRRGIRGLVNITSSKKHREQGFSDSGVFILDRCGL